MLTNIKQHIRLRKHENILIHIGKCGGSSLRRAIRQSRKLRITGIVHVSKPVYVRNKNYYIVARDPVSRCISAFNWRYRLVVTERSQMNRFDGEFEVLKKYGVLNNLAENLFDSRGVLEPAVAAEFETIHHLRERISFYLTDFLADCPPEKIKCVFMQETLNQDIERMLGVASSSIAKEKRNERPEGGRLSPRGKRNLVRYLQEDYNCLFHLYNIGRIDRECMLRIYQNAISVE